MPMRADPHAVRQVRVRLVLMALGTALLGPLASATPAGAHALSPALLVLRELGGGLVDVTWKIPLIRITGTELRPILPAACTADGPPTTTEDMESLTTRWRVACGSADLVGTRVGVDGLAGAKTDALVRLELADGRSVDTVLRASDPALVVPARTSPLDVVGQYGALGVEHIMTGYDHLLFVFGLLLLAADWRRLVATITAFTLGHSITLTLAVLDVARVPSAPVEVLIAFSIFVLAVELARPAAADADATLMRRRPWLMALGFGFLHGLGFAGVLREVGLPAEAIPTALLGFNVGIELGQLAFVALTVAIGAALRPLVRAWPAWTRAVPVYAMGSLAACWMIERALPLW
jgi:hydrogenase/urease accessory protein HupE